MSAEKCSCCGVQIAQIRRGRNKGRFGWVRVLDGELQQGTETFGTKADALAAAHRHYGGAVH